MTNGWIDIKNTDMMLIMGGNPAENHPCGFKWPIEAKLERNAKMIVVDPRFTRTAANADLFLQIRAGIRHRLPRRPDQLRHRARPHRPRLPRQLHQRLVHRPGRIQAARRRLVFRVRSRCATYDRSTWNYEGAGGEPPATRLRRRRRDRGARSCRNRRAVAIRAGRRRRAPRPSPSSPKRWCTTPTLEHPRCVFQLLKKQYSRYTPEMVERITGIPKDQFLKAAELFTSIRKDGDMKKAATIIYAVGWTQHTFGTQIIRAAAMLQLLMGNVGRAGGGVNALRGHSNIQGATDMAGIFDILPGYLKMAAPDDVDFATYLKRTTPTVVEAGRVGLVQLLVQHAEVHCLAAEGDLRRRGTKRERLGVQLSARRSIAITRGPRSGTACTRDASRACLPSA